MSMTKNEFFKYELLHYFVTKHQYQVIRVNNNLNDLWLANAHAKYPIIRISSDQSITQETLVLIKNIVDMISELISCKKDLLIVDLAEQASVYQLPNMKYCHVTPTDISNQEVSKEFGNLSLLLKDHENRQEMASELSKEIELAQKANEKRFIKDTKKRLRPKLSYLFIALSVLFTLFMILIRTKTVEVIPALVANGAYYKANVVAAHEYWRLFSAAFVYPDIFTCALMLWIFYRVAKQCEPLYKKKEIILLSLGSILVGYASVMISDGNVVAFGAGSLIWGLTGAYFVAMISSKAYRIPLIMMEMVRIGMFAIFSWTLPGMSIIGHISGLLFGVLFSCSVVATTVIKPYVKHIRNALVLFVCMLVVACFYARTKISYDPTFDQSVTKTYQTIHLDGYAKYLESCYEKAYGME